MKKYLIVAVILGVSILVVFQTSRNGVIENLKTKEITFTSELGFVNWGHALPGLTKSKFSEFQSKNRTAIDSFDFSYGQQVSTNVFSKKAVMEFNETRRFPSGLSELDEKQAFFELFSSVSIGFEDEQSSFPFMLVPGSSGSSFRSGDLMGNLISFYCAVENAEISQLKESLTHVPTDEVLLKIKNKEIETLYRSKWAEVVTDVNTFNDLTSALMNPVHLQAKNKKTFSAKMKEEIKWFWQEEE